MIASAALLALAGTAFADRGRVRNQNNVIVADDGYMIRACTILAHDFQFNLWKDPAWWTNQRNVGHFNAVRIMGFLGLWAQGSQTMDLGTLLNHLDVAVANAAQAGMYLIIDDHSTCCGSYNASLSTQFWTAVAPRYANRTHVIYEFKNEPVDQWQPNSGIQYDSGTIQFEVNGYKLIRSKAPNSHIILWTFMRAVGDLAGTVRLGSGVDYSNASVGFHTYPYDRSAVLALKSSYPVINTEWDMNGGTIRNPSEFESLGISWMWLGVIGWNG
jgi:hypothetical protein